jgi:hypothetical protein
MSEKATGAFNQKQKEYFSQNIVHHFGKEISLTEFNQSTATN